MSITPSPDPVHLTPAELRNLATGCVPPSASAKAADELDRIDAGERPQAPSHGG